MQRFVCFVMASLSAVFAAEFDLIVQHGRVIDGTGAPAFMADIAVKDGRIVGIGKMDGARAVKVIDATGMVVAPGFIDTHTHAEDILDLPVAENFIRMGVTTLMLGNCGGSNLDVDKFFQRVVATNVCPNVATLIGHNTVRRAVMGGAFDRAPSGDEMKRMKDYVRAAMKAGAFGLSTGLIYLPGTFSKTEEIIELAKVSGEFGGNYVSHMRDEGLEIDDALNELFRIAREAKVRGHISHIKLSGKSAWGRASQILEMIDKARAEGLDITQDQYVYTASSTGISQLVPDWAREGNKYEARIGDPATRARIKEEMRAGLERRGFPDFAYAVIANYEPDPTLNGLNIVEAAQKKRNAATLDDQMELILKIQSSASGVFHSMGEEDLQTFLGHPNTMLASDSGVRKFQQGVPHPRGYGNNARALHRYVNELHVLRLEEAIRRMTSLPASAFRISDRGQIHEHFWADLVVFDPKQVADRATFAQPHQYAEGMVHVLVNGAPVIENSALTKERPGQSVRFGTH